MADMIQRQLELEEEMLGMGTKRYLDRQQKAELSDLPPGVALIQASVKPMVEAIVDFIQPKRGGGKLAHTRKYFLMFDPAEMAYIAVRRCVNSIALEEPIQRVAISIVQQLADQLEYKKFKKESPGYLAVVQKNLVTDNMRHRRAVILRAKRKLGIEDTLWTQEEQFAFGAKLIDMVVSATGLIELYNGKHKGKDAVLVRGTAKTKAWVEKKHGDCSLMEPVYLPMLIKPRPWVDHCTGGFLTNAGTMRHRLVKTRDKDVLDALSLQEMPEVFKAINAVQDTPWQINQRILDVMEELWACRCAAAGIPSQEMEELPAKPWSSDSEYAMLKETAPEVIKEWKMKATQVYDEWHRSESKRHAFAAKLMVARKFKDEKEIFFCWTMDFRGRFYPIQHFVNPQADDAGKALLRFTEGKRFGIEGWFWFRVSLANSFGIDKVSFADRIKWVQDNEGLILQAAADPFNTVEWWGNADSPFVFLAHCLEYLEARLNTVCPVDYVSHMPVNMDGSCNGLQHFSAALLDSRGAAAVNLINHEKPADIYSEVKDEVIDMVERLMLGGDEMAKVWHGKVDRGICKRAVMTTPYGVTERGITDQLVSELRQRGLDYLGVADLYAAAKWLTPLLSAAIASVVVAARDAMDWLQDAAAKALEAKEGFIKWSTPTNFPVVQAYRKQQGVFVNTNFGGTRTRLKLNKDVEGGAVDKRHSRNGVAPNWVHSLDATHMVKTINAMVDAGIRNFAMIHDSYGTHAADVETMNRLLRETFVALYSEDQLARFYQELLAQVPPEAAPLIPPPPRQGCFDLEAVKNSRYFFA